MIFLHMVNDILNIDALINNVNNVSLMNIVAVIILPYLGGLAGFFLMISAVGNMVSMQKRLQRGNSVKELVVRQIVGGSILLLFAMLTESTIGQWGYFGQIIKHMNNPASVNPEVMLYRWNHFETIHTIAWCVILNGIIQGILSRNEKWRDTKHQIKTYIILSVIIIALTQPVWNLVFNLVPGYPFGSYDSNTFNQMAQPIVGKASFWEVLRSPFLAALAAPMEPLFPYLAVSFIGSIIGIILSQPRKTIPHNFPKKALSAGLIMFIIGSIGVVWVIFWVVDTQGLMKAIELFRLISFHRHWTPDMPSVTVPPLAWLWQFLSLNGFALMLIVAIFRLVEFRGISKTFAEKTKFIRRFGFIAFTNYADQWIYSFTFFMLSLLFIGVPNTRLSWGLTFVVIGVTLLVYHVKMRLWEKIKYIGSLEWCIGTIALNLIPTRRDSSSQSKKWWQKSQLDVDGAFYNAEWIDIIEESEINHQALKESKLAYKLSIIAFISIIFMPVTLITLGLAQNSIKKEGKNRYNKIAKMCSIIGITIVIIFVIFCFATTPTILGFSLV
jgi:hypothetical protein